MSNLVVILGPTGSGKSTSIKNLDPKETMVLALKDIDKALPFKGSRKLYNKENKNYYTLKNWEEIITYMESASKNLTNVISEESLQPVHLFVKISMYSFSFIQSLLHRTAIWLDIKQPLWESFWTIS